MAQPILVVCDRCRAEGLACADPFEAFGALLDFDPVPRLTRRADGWDAEVQRAYIAALSLTGSDRAACRAVGKSAFGITQLLAHEGADSFAAAREEALAIAADERSRRFAEGLRAVADDQAGWRRPDAPWSTAGARRGPGRPAAPSPVDRGEPPRDPDSKEALDSFADGLIKMIMTKTRQERSARLAGEIVAADFYLRQITWLETALELGSGSGFEVLARWRSGSHALLQVAESPLARLLDAARRAAWAELDEPERPSPIARDLLVDEGGFSTEPQEFATSASPLGIDEQWRAFAARHAEDARAQIEWEARARRMWEARERARPGEGESESKAEAEAEAEGKSGYEGGVEAL